MNDGSRFLLVWELFYSQRQGPLVEVVRCRRLFNDVIDFREGRNWVRTLTGTSAVVSEPDLTGILDNGGLDAVDFKKNCDQYYDTPFDLLWDLDLNGSYETKGPVAFFNASYLDGPSVINVPAQARHPLGGATAQTTARITVRNVKPRVTQFSMHAFPLGVRKSLPLSCLSKRGRVIVCP